MLHDLDTVSLSVLILRLPLAMFFIIRGYQKLFISTKREALFRTLVADKLPWPKFLEWWVPTWQFVAGWCLAIGLFTSFSAGVLALIMAVALFSDKIEETRVKRNPNCCADWFCCITYVSETMWIVIFTVIILLGSGAYSMDHLLFK